MITSNARANADGSPIVRSQDTFLVSGCPFTLPGGTPHPCMRVQWVQRATRVQVLSDYVLTEASVGLCMAADGAAQGTVMVNSTQTKAAGQ